jgi:hypothetical protein
MYAIIIKSVSPRAAKAAFTRLTTTINVIQSSPFLAQGGFLKIELMNDQEHGLTSQQECLDAPKNAVMISSNYYTECGLMEIAEKVSGQGTVSIA